MSVKADIENAPIAKFLRCEAQVNKLSKDVEKLIHLSTQHGTRIKELFQSTSNSVSQVEFMSAITTTRFQQLNIVKSMKTTTAPGVKTLEDIDNENASESKESKDTKILKQQITNLESELFNSNFKYNLEIKKLEHELKVSRKDFFELKNQLNNVDNKLYSVIYNMKEAGVPEAVVINNTLPGPEPNYSVSAGSDGARRGSVLNQLVTDEELDLQPGQQFGDVLELNDSIYDGTRDSPLHAEQIHGNAAVGDNFRPPSTSNMHNNTAVTTARNSIHSITPLGSGSMNDLTTVLANQAIDTLSAPHPPQLQHPHQTPVSGGSSAYGSPNRRTVLLGSGDANIGGNNSPSIHTSPAHLPAHQQYRPGVTSHQDQLSSPQQSQQIVQNVPRRGSYYGQLQLQKQQQAQVVMQNSYNAEYYQSQFNALKDMVLSTLQQTIAALPQQQRGNAAATSGATPATTTIVVQSSDDAATDVTASVVAAVAEVPLEKSKESEFNTAQQMLGSDYLDMLVTQDSLNEYAARMSASEKLLSNGEPPAAVGVCSTIAQFFQQQQAMLAQQAVIKQQLEQIAQVQAELEESREQQAVQLELLQQQALQQAQGSQQQQQRSALTLDPPESDKTGDNVQLLTEPDTVNDQVVTSTADGLKAADVALSSTPTSLSVKQPVSPSINSPRPTSSDVPSADDFAAFISNGITTNAASSAATSTTTSPGRRRRHSFAVKACQTVDTPAFTTPVVLLDCRVLNRDLYSRVNLVKETRSLAQAVIAEMVHTACNTFESAAYEKFRVKVVENMLNNNTSQQSGGDNSRSLKSQQTSRGATPGHHSGSDQPHSAKHGRGRKKSIAHHNRPGSPSFLALADGNLDSDGISAADQYTAAESFAAVGAGEKKKRSKKGSDDATTRRNSMFNRDSFAGGHSAAPDRSAATKQSIKNNKILDALKAVSEQQQQQIESAESRNVTKVERDREKHSKSPNRDSMIAAAANATAAATSEELVLDIDLKGHNTGAELPAGLIYSDSIATISGYNSKATSRRGSVVRKGSTFVPSAGSATHSAQYTATRPPPLDLAPLVTTLQSPPPLASPPKHMQNKPVVLPGEAAVQSLEDQQPEQSLQEQPQKTYTTMTAALAAIFSGGTAPASRVVEDSSDAKKSSAAATVKAASPVESSSQNHTTTSPNQQSQHNQHTNHLKQPLYSPMEENSIVLPSELSLLSVFEAFSEDDSGQPSPSTQIRQKLSSHQLNKAQRKDSNRQILKKANQQQQSSFAFGESANSSQSLNDEEEDFGLEEGVDRVQNNGTNSGAQNQHSTYSRLGGEESGVSGIMGESSQNTTFTVEQIVGECMKIFDHKLTTYKEKSRTRFAKLEEHSNNVTVNLNKILQKVKAIAEDKKLHSAFIEANLDGMHGRISSLDDRVTNNVLKPLQNNLEHCAEGLAAVEKAAALQETHMLVLESKVVDAILQTNKTNKANKANRESMRSNGASVNSAEPLSTQQKNNAIDASNKAQIAVDGTDSAAAPIEEEEEESRLEGGFNILDTVPTDDLDLHQLGLLPDSTHSLSHLADALATEERKAGDSQPSSGGGSRSNNNKISSNKPNSIAANKTKAKSFFVGSGPGGRAAAHSGHTAQQIVPDYELDSLFRQLKEYSALYKSMVENYSKLGKQLESSALYHHKTNLQSGVTPTQNMTPRSPVHLSPTAAPSQTRRDVLDILEYEDVLGSHIEIVRIKNDIAALKKGHLTVSATAQPKGGATGNKGMGVTRQSLEFPSGSFASAPTATTIAGNKVTGSFLRTGGKKKTKSNASPATLLPLIYSDYLPNDSQLSQHGQQADDDIRMSPPLEDTALQPNTLQDPFSQHSSGSSGGSVMQVDIRRTPSRANSPGKPSSSQRMEQLLMAESAGGSHFVAPSENLGPHMNRLAPTPPTASTRKSFATNAFKRPGSSSGGMIPSHLRETAARQLAADPDHNPGRSDLQASMSPIAGTAGSHGGFRANSTASSAAATEVWRKDFHQQNELHQQSSLSGSGRESPQQSFPTTPGLMTPSTILRQYRINNSSNSPNSPANQHDSSFLDAAGGAETSELLPRESFDPTPVSGVNYGFSRPVTANNE